jgi:VIT1/CCC1 family predicted Fe2+/Mn2+ transporter
MTAVIPEHHKSHRSGWLRAAVLGANDGIVSTASLLVGVAAAGSSHTALVTAGLAGLIAGAMSMAAGEFVSVSSQRDTEQADLEIERLAIAAHPEAELRELARIYEHRGLDPVLAIDVARALHAHDPVGSHARDELGLTEVAAARPMQAAATSALAFTVGAALPLLAGIAAGRSTRIPVTIAVALVSLVVLGVIGARAGGAHPGRAAGRVLLWSSAAMGLTFAIGRLVGTNLA